MASAGYKTGVELSDDGSTWEEVDGIKSVTVTHDRIELDITDFATTGNGREKIMGLRDASFQLSGDAIGGDAGQELFWAAYLSTDDDPPLYIRVINGDGYGVSCKITAANIELGAEVEGLASFSASGSQNGTLTRVTP